MSNDSPAQHQADKVNYRVAIKREMRHQILSTLGGDPDRLDNNRCYKALAYTVRNQLISKWIQTQRSYYTEDIKRVYYLSMEFLLGRLLTNTLINSGINEPSKIALEELGFNLEEIEEREMDAGLGNGGLGRLAACFLDSMATLRIPTFGYGILYEYGMFYQRLVNGYQVENPDNWLRYGCPWKIERSDQFYIVKFGGWVDSCRDEGNRWRYTWQEEESVLATPCDILLPGYGNDFVINLRLWAAKSSREFNLDFFHKGNYFEAMEEKVKSENISKVLYPSEDVQEGRELRFKQEYFMVSATFQDIIRRYKKSYNTFEKFPELVAVQLNDTHPAIAIAEFMRLLLDEEGLDWEFAWELCVKTFGYTNHTIMPEALETWPVEMMRTILPRHLEIIYEINHRFLEKVALIYPDDINRLQRMSLIEENHEKRVRMAHLAIVGSHSINGVSQVHTRILQQKVFKDFYEMLPERFNNKTNGISPRRWLLQANPPLSELISENIGSEWITDLDRLQDLMPLADNPDFRERWREVKQRNKKRLARLIHNLTQIDVNINTLFDVHVKRIHEYKRQILNVLHVITLFNRLQTMPLPDAPPRTVFLSGKAAPGYWMAKLIIKLINSVAERINFDKNISDFLRIVFVPNYCVSMAEKIIPGAELSQQISTAGTEASGTGNMKFALNGALTIGTMDGANIEIMEAVGKENIFIFGLDTAGVSQVQASNYNPRDYYYGDDELRLALDQISGGFFSPGQPELFRPIIDSLLGTDWFLVLADFRSYMQCQEEVGRIYLDQEDWTRRCILNVAHIGKFSSDHTIQQYSQEIWRVGSLKNNSLSDSLANP
jgi:starch phosphorylase